MHWQILGRTLNTRAAGLVGEHQQTSPLGAPSCPQGPRVPLNGGSNNAGPSPGGALLLCRAGSYC